MSIPDASTNIRVHNAFTQGRSAGIRQTDPVNGGSESARDTFESDTATATVDVGELFPNKVPNPLHQYNSFNCIFTLACLTLEEINFPARLRQKSPQIIIVRSGGSGQSKFLTPYDLDFNGGTSNTRTAREYFIGDVNINTMIGPQDKGQSNVTKLEFTVYEPYSMGTFVETLRLSGLKAGFKNYIEAPWCLIIEFIGHTLDNKVESVKDALGNSTKRIFPIKIGNIDFTADQAGARYTIQAIPTSDIALQNSTQTIPKDVKIEGTTVQEMLQIALQNELNKNRKAKNKNKTTLEEINDVIINFPTQEAQEKLSQRTSYQDAELAATSTADLQRSNIIGTGAQVVSSPNATSYVQSKDSLNNIGNSKINLTNQQNKNVGSEDDNTFYDKFTKLSKFRVRGQIPNLSFKQGTNLTNIITNVILLSEYGQRLFQPSDANGFKTWFKIVPRAFYINDTVIVEKKGTYPLLIVIDVIEHKVHESLFAKINRKTQTENFHKFVVKEYDYLFTGKNLDVLKFDIQIKGSFQQQLPSDQANSKEDPNKKTKNEGEKKETSADDKAGDAAAQGVGTGKLTANFYASPRRKNYEALGELTTEQRLNLEFHDMIMTGNISLVDTTIELLGDPYFLADSGLGNYYSTVDNDPRTGQKKFINKDGSAEPTFQGIYCVVNFRTPIDYTSNGNMVFKGTANALNKNFVQLDEFSGVYKVNFVDNIFTNGTFTQNLKLIRVLNQEITGKSTSTTSLGQPIYGDSEGAAPNVTDTESF